MTKPAGVLLAAGLGTRLRPLTTLVPKPLCPVNNRPLLEYGLELLEPHCGSGREHLMVNAFHLADQVVGQVGDRALVSVETELMGTAGALALVHQWRAGRPVLLVNGDAYLTSPSGPAGVLDPLLTGWDGETVRMLVVPVEENPDFPADDRDDTDGRGWRYVGGCLLPSDLLDPLPAQPGGLFRQVWQPARQAGRLEFVEHHGVAIDTGTPAGYLAANLEASRGRTVIGAGAVLDGTAERCVLWPGARVRSDEQLIEAIRVGDEDPITVTVR